MDRPIPLSRRQAFAWAAVWALVVGAVYWTAVRTSWGQGLDEALLERWHSEDLVVRRLAAAVRSTIPLALSVVVARLCLVAWRAGLRRLVLVVGSVVLVTVVLSPLLRDVLLARPDLGAGGLPDNTLPSNHMAFSTAAAVAVLLLRRCGARWAGLRHVGPGGAAHDWRVGALLALLLGVEAVVNVTTYAHRPADTVAGLAEALMLWSLAVGVAPGVVPGARAGTADAQPVCSQRCGAP